MIFAYHTFPIATRSFMIQFVGKFPNFVSVVSKIRFYEYENPAHCIVFIDCYGGSLP